MEFDQIARRSKFLKWSNRSNDSSFIRSSITSFQILWMITFWMWANGNVKIFPRNHFLKLEITFTTTYSIKVFFQEKICYALIKPAWIEYLIAAMMQQILALVWLNQIDFLWLWFYFCGRWNNRCKLMASYDWNMHNHVERHTGKRPAR